MPAQKSWNVYNWDNKTRVERDEAEAEAEQGRQREEAIQGERDSRREALLQQYYGESTSRQGKRQRAPEEEHLDKVKGGAEESRRLGKGFLGPAPWYAREDASILSDEGKIKARRTKEAEREGVLFAKEKGRESQSGSKRDDRGQKRRPSSSSAAGAAKLKSASELREERRNREQEERRREATLIRGEPSQGSRRASAPRYHSGFGLHPPSHS